MAEVPQIACVSLDSRGFKVPFFNPLFGRFHDCLENENLALKNAHCGAAKDSETIGVNHAARSHWLNRCWWWHQEPWGKARVFLDHKMPGVQLKLHSWLVGCSKLLMWKYKNSYEIKKYNFHLDKHNISTYLWNHLGHSNVLSVPLKTIVALNVCGSTTSG